METIGQQLRAARERKKITLEVAAQATKIKGDYLAALEANQFDRIEASVYVKGFLRIYAQYLGLDFKPLVDLFIRMQSEEVMPLDPPPRPMSPQPIAKTSSPPSNESQAITLPPGAIIGVLIAILALLVVVGAGMSAYKWFGRNSSSARNSTEQSQPSSPAKTEASPQLAPKNVTPAQIIEPARPAAHRITIQADKACDEVAITVDGAVVFKYKMALREVRQFPVQRSAVVRASNGDAISVWFDGKAQGKLGRPGAAAEKKF